MDSVEMETGSVELMIQNLHDAVDECIETGDYLSLSTILDIYMTKSVSFNMEDKENLLVEIYLILAGNHQLVYNIGWDLPPLLLKLLNSDWYYTGPLRESKGPVTIMNIFELLANYGNPKELLLIVCELFSTLKQETSEKDREYIEYLIENDEDEELINYYRNKAYRTYLITFHCLIEVTAVCLKRNDTLYPSKFLSMAVSALKNFMSSMDKSTNLMPVTRRLYVFVRDYQPPSLPKNKPDDYTLENYRDEEFLQRKLLVCLFGIIVKESTFHVGHNFSNFILKIDDKKRHQNIGGGINDKEEEGTVSGPFLGDNEFEFMDRFLSLGFSLDIDFEELFIEELNSKVKFIDSIKISNTNAEDNELIESIVKHYNETTKDLQKLPIYIETKILLYTKCYLFNKDQILLKSKLPNFEESMKLALYYITAISINLSKTPERIEGSSLLCGFMVLIYNSVNNENCKIILTDKMELYIKSLFHCMLFSLGQILDILALNSLVKKMFYTMLVKVVANITINNPKRGELFVKDFLIDSIINCPITEFQLNFVQILKDLIIQNKPIIGKIEKFINLNENKVSKDIIKLIKDLTDESTNKNKKLSELEISKLLSLINLSGTILNQVNEEDKLEITKLMIQLKKKIPISNNDENETNIPLELLKFNVDTVIDLSGLSLDD